MASAKSEAIKAECRKVYEAIRYSDPMKYMDIKYQSTSVRMIISHNPLMFIFLLWDGMMYSVTIQWMTE
jgi:hypothetical protein